MAADQPSEDLAWKTVQRWAVDRERSEVTRLARLVTWCWLCDGCRRGVRRWPSRADRPADLVGDVVAHERARTNLAVEIAFLQQLIKGAEHRVARDLQLFGERPCGRQALTGAQPSRRDCRPDSLVDLQIERHRRRPIERDDRDHP